MVHIKTEVILSKKVNLRDHLLIEGFPGIGLIGTIAANYLIEKRNMEPIGYIQSDRFPPMTTIHKGRPYFPMRIFKDKKEKLCVILAEFVVPGSIVYDLSSTILNFAQQNKIRRIISLAGMTAIAAEKSDLIYGIASNDAIAKELTKQKVKLIQEGVTTGVSGILIAKASSKGFPAMSLLAQSAQRYPDPRAAAKLLDKLSSVIGVKIDTQELLKEAGQIEEKMRRMLTQLQKGRRGYKAAEEEAYPAMYG